MLQLGVEESAARRRIDEDDARSTTWIELLLQAGPYDLSLYDTVVHYNCQDLLDVVAWIYMHYLSYLERLHCSTAGVFNDASVTEMVRNKLSEHGLTGDGTLHNGQVYIGLAMAPCSFDALIPDIMETIGGIEGVAGIKVKRLDPKEDSRSFHSWMNPLPSVAFPAVDGLCRHHDAD